MKDFNGAEFSIEAGKFKKNNGIIIRAIVSLMRNVFFSADEVVYAVERYNIDRADVYEALDYLEGCKYIETRDVEFGKDVRMADFIKDLDRVEFKLSSSGKQIAMGIIKDPAIEL